MNDTLVHTHDACAAGQFPARGADLDPRSQPGRDPPTRRLRRHDRATRRLRRAVAVGGVLVTLAPALAGCGAPDRSDIPPVVGGAAHVAHAITGLSRQLMRSWCPQASANGGPGLNEEQARACLRRAWQSWLRQLQRNGYDPRQIAGSR
jgi:hypothetical protein